MKTIDDALKYADTFDKPANKHMSIVMLASEVRRLQKSLDLMTAERDHWKANNAAPVNAVAVPAVPNALQMEREWLEGWLHCMAEPMGQMCCGRSMFECCGSPDPVYPDLSYISASMSKRRTEIIALLQSAPQAPAERRHYPEEWGPSYNRRMTCSCGNSLPCPEGPQSGSEPVAHHPV